MNYRILTAIAALLITGLTFAQETPVDYMSELSEPVTELKSQTWQYMKSVTRGKGSKKVDKTRSDLIARIKEAEKTIKSKPGWNGSTDYRDAVSTYLGMQYTVMKEDYDKILDMEEIKEQSYDLMEAYILAQEKAGEKLSQAFDVLDEAQKKFAEENNITLTKAEMDKTSKKIRNAGEMLDYYNEVYLIFFKPYKQEMYTLAAQSTNDVSGVEQNATSLSSLASEGLKKLKATGDFRGDASLRIAGQNLMNFYVKEGDKQFPDLVNFYVSKEEYERIKKIIDSKDEKDLTQEEVDTFNGAVKEYNAGVADFNKTIEMMNSQRSKLIDEWNSKIDSFFSTHSE